jgi:stringent starvation protein B
MTDDIIKFSDLVVPYDQFQISGLAGWIECNGYKPHLIVSTKYPGVVLPPQCMVKRVEVVNIHSNACGRMEWADDKIRFNARFGGRDFRLTIPYKAIVAMQFAGTGMVIPMPWSVERQVEIGDMQHLTDVAAEAKSTPVEQDDPVSVDGSAIVAVTPEDDASASVSLEEAKSTVVHAKFGQPREKK